MEVSEELKIAGTDELEADDPGRSSENAAVARCIRASIRGIGLACR